MSLFLHGNVADVSDSGDDDGDDFFNYEEFLATPFINKQKCGLYTLLILPVVIL